MADKKRSIEELQAAFADLKAKGAEAPVEEVLGTAEQLIGSFQAKVSTFEQIASEAEQDVEELNKKLADYENGTAKIEKPTFTHDKQKYRIKYPSLDINGVVVTAADVKNNVKIKIDGKEVSVQAHLVKTNSGMIKAIKS